MSVDLQEVIIAKLIIDVSCPTWLVIADKTIYAFIGFQSCLIIGSSEVVPVVFEWRVLVVATIVFVPSPHFDFMPLTDLLATIWLDRESAWGSPLAMFLKRLSCLSVRGTHALRIYFYSLTLLSVVGS